MRERQASHRARRAREVEAVVAGAAGRLLHTATLLTAEAPHDNPRARRLLTLALAQTYACWDRLRGEDPYDRTRQYLVGRFAREAWHRHGTWQRHGVRHRPGGLGRTRTRFPGVLAALAPQERLVLVLRLYEGVAEEQAAALLGLPTERVRVICDRAIPAGGAGAPPRPPPPPAPPVVPLQPAPPAPAPPPASPPRRRPRAPPRRLVRPLPPRVARTPMSPPLPVRPAPPVPARACLSVAHRNRKDVRPCWAQRGTRSKWGVSAARPPCSTR